MWLLSTGRAQLHYFASPENIPGGYAILSHVWGEEEQSFQGLLALQKECEASGSNPRHKASEKIRRCCEVAESHGFRWIWNDTCCIDKASSAELSEAINSMYRYYSLAKVCFAYLSDVPGEIGRVPGKEFRWSRWHERGWTLQELLAPRLVVFMSRDWGLDDLSIATRMGFAAGRKTTRPEDRAYSLMGIFDVNIPTLYGEGGERAFQRLQEEIMKHSPDSTLFAWGAALATYRIDTPPDMAHPSHFDHRSFLFASSPANFGILFRRNIRFEPYKFDEPPLLGMDDEQWLDLSAHVPTFSITPYGVLARIFVISWRGLIVALLGWFEGAHRCGLILNPCEHPVDPQHQLFDISIELEGGRFRRRRVFCVMTFNDSEDSELVEATPIASAGWRDVYLSHRPPSSGGSIEKSLSKAWRTIQFSALSLDTPFCFSPERTTGLALIDAYGLLLWDRPLLPWSGAEALLLRLSFDLSSPRRETSSQSESLAFPSAAVGDADSAMFSICVGRCTSPTHGFSSSHLGPHWFNVTFGLDATVHAGEHSCLTDHTPIPEKPQIVWRHWQCPITNGNGLLEDLYVGFEQCSYNPERLIVTLTDSHKTANSSFEPPADSRQ